MLYAHPVLKGSYRTTPKILVVAVIGLRAQCHRWRTSVTAFGLGGNHRHQGHNIREGDGYSATGERWRMFHAFPRRMTPSLVCDPPCSIGGRNDLCIRQRRFFGNAAWMAVWSDSGSCGAMWVRIWFYRSRPSF